MSQNSGPFLPSAHGHSSFNPRLPPASKRISNGPMSVGNSPNTSIGPNMNLSSSSPSSLIRASNSIGPMKPGTVGMNPMDKSNSMPYSSRYTRKGWPMPRSIHGMCLNVLKKYQYKYLILDKSIRGHDEHETPYLRSGLSSHGAPSDGVSGSSFTIEPSADDDESDDIFFSSRHMAAARFQRNQRLIGEIFNEICIPDLRSNVNVDRILTLRRQVDALKTHRQTFEKDLNELEEKHIEKKRKFSETNEKFYSEYAEASSTNLSREKIDEVLKKYETMEKLQKEKQLLLQQQQQQQAVATLPPSTTTPTVSQSGVPPSMKIEPIPTVEASQQQVLSTVSTQLPPSQPASVLLPPSQPTSNQVPVSQSVPSQIPPSQPVSTHLAPSQPVQTQLPSSQTVQLPLPLSQPVQTQLPHPPSGMQQPQPTSQAYPMMHPGGSYPSAPGYGHPHQAQYRQSMNQRPTQYPQNVQWQQPQHPQQQWQANTYGNN
jgi:hypothetical protein